MRYILTVLLIVWAGFASAQTTDDDRDFITGLIEDTVSNDDFTVRLINFDGALSSKATADAITIADPDGVWLRLEGLEFVWDRSALLSGRVEIETLSAQRIELVRLPATSGDSDIPSPTAEPFSLPDLPVSVDIADVSANEIVLTEALLGEPVIAQFAGSLMLNDGSGSVAFTLERTDSKDGAFEVDASYENETRQLGLLVLAREGQNGIAARLLNLPDRPSVRLEIAGDAPLDDFVGDIALATDGADRVTGTVALSRPSGTVDQAFAVDLSGDLRPLLASQYDAFFGTQTVLRAQGTQFGVGGLRLSEVTIAADQVVLRGAAEFDAQGWPTSLDVRGRLGSGDTTRVLLPIGGAPTEVSGMSLDVQYDVAAGDMWTGAFDITSLARDGIAIDVLALSGGGEIQPGAGGAIGQFTADLTYAARGLALDDPALIEAIGSDIEGTLRMGRREGDALSISALTLQGAGITAQGRAIIGGPSERFRSEGEIAIEAEDFARFAALTGLDISGTGAVDVAGSALPFDGVFDVAVDARTRDLALGIAQADPLLRGDSTVSLRLDRDTTGTRLSDVEVTSNGVIATGFAEITEIDARGELRAELTDLALITRGLSGPATLRTDVSTDESRVITLRTDISAPRASAAFEGTANPLEDGYILRGDGTASITDLGAYSAVIGQPVSGGLSFDLDGTFVTQTGVLDADVVARTQDIGIASPTLDRVLAGLGRISANVSLSQTGRLRLDALNVAFPNLSAQGNITSTGADTTADLSVRLRDVALLVSDFSGPLQADITARQVSTGWDVTGDATGPANTAARATGRVLNNGNLDLNVTGSAPLALANLYIAPRQINGLAQFDVAISGPPALSSVRGPVRIENARLSAPTLGQAIENLDGTILMAGGTARLDLGGTSAQGGRVTLTGPVGLTPPFQAALVARLSDIVLRDPELYMTTAQGEIAVIGPLAGGASIQGAIDLGAVEVQVPSTGVSALGTLPAVTHLGIPTDVRATLDRAGVGTTAQVQQTRSAGPDFPLDVVVRAPSRIFVRGRGLDAELGGQLRLTGSTNNVVPIGRFDLVRGRLSILGQRFELDEGFAQLQGDFTPYLRLVATTQAATGTDISIIIEGPADEIDVRFESSPELPQDEVIAQLLFGRDLSSISPLQAVQLASAVATLAGTGGGNGGVFNSLREGLDLDDLDFITDENGNAAVRAGKYISDNVYTDVTVGANGTSEINLNIDIDDNFTARGSVASDGETSVGIFFERDY